MYGPADTFAMNWPDASLVLLQFVGSEINLDEFKFVVSRAFRVDDLRFCLRDARFVAAENEEIVSAALGDKLLLCEIETSANELDLIWRCN